MPRTTLTVAGFALSAALASAPAQAVHPHMDLTVVTGGCRACHAGHGVSSSPMLPAPQSDVCLSCHSSRAAADEMVSRGLLSPTADPQLLSLELLQPFVHPVDSQSFSRSEPGAVTCTSCHSPHRRSVSSVSSDSAGAGRKLSTRDPNAFEVDLCAGCHGSAGVGTQSLLDLSRLTNPNNRSFHPLEAPALERSPSLIPEFSDREINCTDCHDNSDPEGARGPHGSAVRYLLKQEYITVDGSPEGPESYGLCYGCHQREAVLDEGPFPFHRLHVADQMVSCATCHSAHGSVENRALIRFGEETAVANVSPSGISGRLRYVSTGPGSGSCYVSCHGVDHAPASYGSAGLITAPLLESMDKPGGTRSPSGKNLIARPPRPPKPRRPPHHH
ncbi:MAG: cytochrome c3 family protein [Thermoanaerobaculia bacterium]